MRCFSCQLEIAVGAGERVGFRDECSACGADLHVCRNCAHHDPAAYNECREPNAERVADRERANRCDYFSCSFTGSPAEAGDAAGALADLEALFKK